MIQLLLKNKLTDFIASVSEAVRGIFLLPAKLRPQKNVTMFTNRKRVYTTSCELSLKKRTLNFMQRRSLNFIYVVVTTRSHSWAFLMPLESTVRLLINLGNAIQQPKTFFTDNSVPYVHPNCLLAWERNVSSGMKHA